MECPNLPKPETPEPRLSIVALEGRCKTLALKFGTAIGQPLGSVAFALESSSTVALMTLRGRASESITRNRGVQHHVVPLAALRNDVYIWTGYREAWQRQGAEKDFRFVEGGFTLHIGRPGELAKPQILRSEWVGRRSRAFVDLAGHPHWQLDVLESARTAGTPAPTRFGDLSDFQAVTEFDSSSVFAEGSDLLRSFKVENMHFASAALWWRSSGAQVAHLPECVADVDRWILGCVAYLRQEAERCELVV